MSRHSKIFSWWFRLQRYELFMHQLYLAGAWKTGQEWFLTSWKSQDYPGTGNYTSRLYPNWNQSAKPQYFVYQDLTRYWRSDPWAMA
ncbi:putative non-specific serine/threonine protein kinase [Rosa chinensis]|uniref:Putative non-specific serine/threonine protein kinase n=1 Tax=Rosa chinensis TaxID=74649 RepID=A0A2P6RCQ7_ROSCH|nr:putative non-specific serine/threonine protein kinase [Rosa chinensis]